MATNWKNVIDNFLECYHCHIAHKEFVNLVDMDTYEVRAHGIWSSHFDEAGTHANSAYDVAGASVRQHAMWWLWPNTGPCTSSTWVDGVSAGHDRRDALATA